MKSIFLNKNNMQEKEKRRGQNPSSGLFIFGCSVCSVLLGIGGEGRSEDALLLAGFPDCGFGQKD